VAKTAIMDAPTNTRKTSLRGSDFESANPEIPAPRQMRAPRAPRPFFLILPALAMVSEPQI